ncbi:MAG: sulfurtransferase [Deltaproteobacteria bacterium]|jgi:thiosulfate/3-mercaptopyruvate sulfurtransferase|nr:sulfurtransferase [Deltaproteobacteria bacterium]
MQSLKTIALTNMLLLALPILAAAAIEDYFVQTGWLAMNHTEVVVLDARQAPLYLLGHVDGAYSVPRSEFLDKRGGVKSLVPTTTDFEILMERFGITPDTTVITYAEHDNPYAARLAWTLRYHGHEKTLVLDGGYEKWSREGHPTSMLPTTTAVPSEYRVTSPGEARAEVDYVLTRLGNPGVLVWDTRTTEEYLGTRIRADRGGHIPGAVHLNWTELQHEVNGVKVLRPEPEIRALLAAHNINDGQEIIAHCQTGIRSSYATLVLQALDYNQVKNYDGSWIEWANNPDLPIVVGAETSQSDEIALLRK